jgi:hypothetical protein
MQRGGRSCGLLAISKASLIGAMVTVRDRPGLAPVLGLQASAALAQQARRPGRRPASRSGRSEDDDDDQCQTANVSARFADDGSRCAPSRTGAPAGDAPRHARPCEPLVNSLRLLWTGGARSWRRRACGTHRRSAVPSGRRDAAAHRTIVRADRPRDARLCDRAPTRGGRYGSCSAQRSQAPTE